MNKLKIVIAYDGSHFKGWQIQPGEKTVQNSLELAIKKIAHTKIKVHGSGRTDTGVHALGQVAHFEIPLESRMTAQEWQRAINVNLPPTIRVLSTELVSTDFHSRFSAKMRIYKYIIINRLSRPVLDKNRGWHIMNELDLKSMKKAAKKLVGTKDFSTFRASSCRAKSPIKTMKSVRIKSRNNKIEIEFQSQSFLQQQVRSMVGCLKYVGEKKWSLGKFVDVMNKKKRILCAPPAPPEGLYLARVIY